MAHQVSDDTVQIRLEAGRLALAGDLTIPERATAIVAFAHGSGSSRFSSRNRFVAEVLNEAGLATLLFDLLSSEEETLDEQTRHLRFDIELLGNRLIGVVDWLKEYETTSDLNLGLFGASTGAAAALVAAAARRSAVRAVVSRGGRPDLAGNSLPAVRAPTLLIVGGYDYQVVELNREAAKSLQAEHRLEIIPQASHLFEEPGKLEEAARLARDWFTKHLISE